MTVLIERESTHPWDEKWDKLLEKLIERCLEQHGGLNNAEVSLLLVDDEAMREINRQQRGMDRTTDVLSFPMLEYEGYDEEGSSGGWDASLLSDEVDPETGDIMLGDIVLSLETAERQAAEYGHSFERELGFLTVHGMMHLLGYDHEKDEDRALMREQEEAVLASMDLARECDRP